MPTPEETYSRIRRLLPVLLDEYPRVGLHDHPALVVVPPHHVRLVREQLHGFDAKVLPPTGELLVGARVRFVILTCEPDEGFENEIMGRLRPGAAVLRLFD
jgi:hypothetical protein